MIRRDFALSAVVAVCWATAAFAEDAYYDVRISELELQEQSPAGPAELGGGSTDWRQRSARAPYAALDGAGDAFLTIVGNSANWARLEDWKRDGRIAIRTTDGKAPTGHLYLPNRDESALVIFTFRVPGDKSKPDQAARQVFYAARQNFYQRLLAREIPGAAWFRYQANQAGAQVQPAAGEVTEAQRRLQNRNAGANELENTFALFSGSRAVSENLQLDRALQLRQTPASDVEIDRLEGITVKEIDWQPLIKDLKPELDPLAASIPADQHAVFFPSFQALVSVADEINRQGTPLMRFVDSRSEDERIKDRYERQLGLPLSLLARLLGGQVIDSVALTGSDPYFFAGTDVALVFEAKQPGVLKTLLLARIGAAVQSQDQVRPVQGKIEGLAYAGFVSPGRQVSSYVAELGRAVVVTNSPAQLAQLAKVHQGKSPAISSLAEYTFFRARYPRGDVNESALLFLSDATIRRWCGPRWRIADSRRVRAAAVLAELQAERLDGLVRGEIQSGPIVGKFTDLDMGDLRVSSAGVQSSVMGSLEFLTPIVELQIDKATGAEADAYRQWRNQYQTNWRWAFDPIALRLSVEEQRIAADLSVMPLIWGSDYRSYVETSLGAQIKPGAGDPHDALIHAIAAVNVKSETLRRSSSFVEGLVKVSPLDWLGESVAWYVDDDPFWQELAAAKTTEEAQRFMERNFARLPIALHCDVVSPAKLTLFLAGAHGLIEQVAPEMTTWETLKYNDQPYVRISPTKRAQDQIREVADLNIYYALWSDGLVVSLNENVLKRALDRKAARDDARAHDKEAPAPRQAWLGSSMALQFDGKAMQQISRLMSSDFQQTMQLRSWGNLPILNEWRSRYPDRNPVELHEQVWHVRLVCPGGGEYVWNDEWQTMESTVFGHPGRPKQPEELSTPWQAIRGGNLGITFEQEGLRAKAVLTREKP